MNKLCQQCHAELAESTAESASATVCPACGGALVSHLNLDPPDAAPRQADHRGILLPRRHAVGGVITPR